jgi:DNA-binding MarR family transcriptional regulator
MTDDNKNRTPAGKVMEELIIAILRNFFLLRAVGKQTGTVTSWGGGYWGLLRSLKLEGAQTVPQLARSRSVSRQHIQKLANEMLQDGVIELVDNPAHKRSKLLHLTPKGEIILQELSAKIALDAENLAQKIDIEDLQIAFKVMELLSSELDKMIKDSS